MTKITNSVLFAAVAAAPDFWAMNPNCSDGDKLSAQDCENDCQDININCIVGCGGNSGCISECTRDFTYCLDRCPCYQNCFNGCPCSYETDYCRDPCHAANEDHYKQCRDQQRVELLLCQEDCGLFNPACEHTCVENYEENLTNCPCSEKCSNGCPCPSSSSYDCTVPITSAPSTISTATPPPNVDIVTGQLTISGPQLNGECYLNKWTPPNASSKATGYQNSIAHYYYGSTPSMTQKYCIDWCKTATLGEYAYAAVQEGTKCYCGNMPPKEEKYAECRVPCAGALGEYCGGTADQASWFMTGNGPEKQRCIYDTEPSFDGAYDITTISTKNPYGNLQHCWAEFKCPVGFEVKYYFDYFFVYYNSSCSNDAVYLISENQSNRWCGTTSSQHRPNLYEWKSAADANVEFQFRTSSSGTDQGFKMRLRCDRK